MVGGCLHLTSGGQPQQVYLLRARRENLGNRRGNQPVLFVKRPEKDSFAAVAHQLAERNRSTRIRTEQRRVLGHAARFAQVRQQRLLVGALLGASVELGQRDDGDFELLGQQLERAGHLGDFLLPVLHPLGRGHQLQVVDDDELQVVTLLQPTALGPDLHQGHVRRVVDEQRRVRDLAHPPSQPGPVVVVHLPGAHRGQAHPRLGGQQSHRDLVPRHLQAEQHGRQAVLDGRGPREIQRQRRIVGRDHALAGEVQVVLAIHLDAPDRPGRHGPDVRDVPPACLRLVTGQALPGRCTQGRNGPGAPLGGGSGR